MAKKLDKEKHEKTSVVTSVDDQEEFWNIVSVGSAENGLAAIGTDVAVADPVKVAILDSGVDYTDDIDVYMRKNFVPGEDDISVIYEDISGHGTSVAGIIAAKDNDEGITGINPNVQLYSARILDENKQAPASRVVAAIDWAIAQDVDIINISFGTTVDSEEIHAAIKRAYDAGILIVAAAGNNGVVEYPAAYDEVIAVGAVDAKGERAEGSAIGDELELVAPGQQIVSTGAFGGVCVVGGTSLAAPHVAGVASVLWQKDKSVSADFIRSLLAFTANQYGEDYEYGNGLVDLDFALSQYDAFKEVYVADVDVLNEQVGDAVEGGTLEVNEKPVVEFADVVYVEGSWAPSKHETLAEKSSMEGRLTGDDLVIVKLGAVAPDHHIGGMKIHSGWHGYMRNVETIPGTNGGKDTYIRACANYVFSYIYLTEIAQGVANGKSPVGFANTVTTSCIDPDTDKHGCKKSATCTAIAIDNIKSKFVKEGIASEDGKGNSTGIISWATLLNGKEVKNRNKSLFIYGMALHAITDMFSHSSFRPEGNKWVIINHKADEKDLYDADDVKCFPNRFECASVASGYVIAHIRKFEVGSVEDYYKTASSVIYDGTFKLGNLSKYIKAVDGTYYEEHKEVFDAMNYLERITP
ncbi:MAG: S8 family peptidase [Lachnospiraceae bacterium]|nr:S8 family peptidase [Lachnospiraceae bacterium]